MNDADKIKFAKFPDSHKQRKSLISGSITVLLSEECMKAAGKTRAESLDGEIIAEKEKFS